jgi:hypothetical protein
MEDYLENKSSLQVARELQELANDAFNRQEFASALSYSNRIIAMDRKILPLDCNGLEREIEGYFEFNFSVLSELGLGLLKEDKTNFLKKLIYDNRKTKEYCRCK